MSFSPVVLNSKETHVLMFNIVLNNREFKINQNNCDFFATFTQPSSAENMGLCVNRKWPVGEVTSTSVLCWTCWTSFMTQLRLFLMESMDSLCAAAISLAWQHSAACLALMALRFSRITTGFSCRHSVSHYPAHTQSLNIQPWFFTAPPTWRLLTVQQQDCSGSHGPPGLKERNGRKFGISNCGNNKNVQNLNLNWKFTHPYDYETFQLHNM